MAHEVTNDAQGLHLGTASSDKVGARGKTPIAAPVITDSGTGTAGTALAAGLGIYTLTSPLTSLATGLSTSAVTLLSKYVLGHKFKLLGFSFVTTVVGTGTSASQVFNLATGATPTAVTGGVLTLTLASQNAIGNVTSATAITAANTGAATDGLSIQMAASGTVFTAGAGYFVIKVQNMDTADAFATLTAALVNQGWAAAS